MNTITNHEFIKLTDTLLAASDSIAKEAFSKFSKEERDASWALAKTNPREFYGRMKEVPLAVSRETGHLLYMLARSAKARAIVEFGTSWGISTLFLSAAIKDNGGGRVIGSEFEPAKVAKAREHLRQAGLDPFVEIREGDARETLKRDLPSDIDLLLLDGAKEMYPAILSLIGPHLRTGAVIVADNAQWSPDYVAHVRSGKNGYMSIPFGEDVELSMKT